LPNSKYFRRFVPSTAILGLASIAGGLGVNLWLNPAGPVAAVGGGTVAQTVTGDAIKYQYGVIQLEITAEGGKLTQVNQVQASASPGYDQALPILDQSALVASSTNFSNVSGATFTSKGYKEALASAISKLK
jgi:hypothetical protein